MLSNKDVRIEGRNIIINGDKHPLDPAVDALIKRANIVQGKFSALDTRLDAIEALEKTASGNPISLTGVAAAYAMGLSMTIEPIQSGSGDPSPTNVRPISGISTATVQTTNGTNTNTATITLGQTVYGGTVNFKTGEVTVTHGMVDLGSLEWYRQNTASSNWRFYADLDLFRKVDVGELCGFVCSTYKEVTASQTWQGIKGVSGNGLTSNSICVCDMTYTDAASFKTAMSGVQLCYELATPVTLTLTPAELELLKGNNTVSGNGVTINISYIGR